MEYTQLSAHTWESMTKNNQRRIKNKYNIIPIKYNRGGNNNNNKWIPISVQAHTQTHTCSRAHTCWLLHFAFSTVVGYCCWLWLSTSIILSLWFFLFVFSLPLSLLLYCAVSSAGLYTCGWLFARDIIILRKIPTQTKLSVYVNCGWNISTNTQYESYQPKWIYRNKNKTEKKIKEANAIKTSLTRLPRKYIHTIYISWMTKKKKDLPLAQKKSKYRSLIMVMAQISYFIFNLPFPASNRIMQAAEKIKSRLYWNIRICALIYQNLIHININHKALHVRTH